MMKCPMCKKELKTTRVRCDGCAIVMEGMFSLPRLARLSTEHQQLAESFLISGGNFKELAVLLDNSYPTLRKRIDDLITELQTLRTQDKKQADEILAGIEAGHIKPEEGIRQIKEMNGEL
ncbi:MAG: DUF2089 family protein [Alphaproteobacteria bacterium]|nr:DUF2089 family protein [Alphaproteobacteria bacterium]MCK5659385.1 DUF2089 family protein [Alphaproteobacteria bacterium]